MRQLQSNQRQHQNFGKMLFFGVVSAVALVISGGFIHVGEGFRYTLLTERTMHCRWLCLLGTESSHPLFYLKGRTDTTELKNAKLGVRRSEAEPAPEWKRMETFWEQKPTHWLLGSIS